MPRGEGEKERLIRGVVLLLCVEGGLREWRVMMSGWMDCI